MKRSNGYGTMIGAGALGGAAIALGLATFSAISGDSSTVDSAAAPVAQTPPVGVSERPSELLASPSPAGGSETVQWEDVQLATELAPFEEDRVWSGERYRLPGEGIAAQVAPQQPPRELEPPPPFEVLGTAASAGSGLAVIRVGNGTPQLVSLGQRVEGYEVASIDNGRVTMQNSERSLSLSVASAAPNGTQNERNSRQERSRNQRNNDDRGNTNAAQARTNIERLMGAAANQTNPAARQQLLGQLQRAAEGMMGAGGQVQINGNQVVVTGENGQRTMTIRTGGAFGPVEGQVQEFRIAVPAERAR